MSIPHSALRTPHSFLMCPPIYYTIAYEINPWMHLSRQANQPRAARQWQGLYDLLTTRLRARVQLLPSVRGLPDLVFTANAGLVVPRLASLARDDPEQAPPSGARRGIAGRLLIRSNFRHPQRQGEEPAVERYFRRRGFRIVRLPRAFNFEGEGDALWMGERLFLGFRFRSDAPAHEALARVVGREVLPLELADRRFYHLDTCFCPLDATSALWYPKAFDRYGRKVIETYVRELIAVSTADALRFACNAIAITHAVVMQAGISRRLKTRLARRGFTTYEVNLSEFLKAGGSAKCLVLRLNAQAA